ncbi:MAG: polysulfide reductase NrfD [Solirubrobacterales bacterium]|nr:polysulfide reductase NrfD [Solirubrobacterales bacterium]
MTPAVGTRGGPGPWRRAVEDAAVAGAARAWADARWSYLYKADTRYRTEDGDEEAVRDAARRMRGGPEAPDVIQGPFIHPAVWTWEVPLYFWFGGIATGSSFASVAADVVDDQRSAVLARRVALAAVMPCAPLLILDLGRPLRFLHMLRIFKPRSPMSMGAWCLSAFSATAGGAVAADLLGRRTLARLAGAGAAVLGTYLGSYTGILLVSTAVPVWGRSRALLPPIFVCTATATGAATCHLVLAAGGLADDHPTRTALRTIENGALAVELVLSAVNERRLGPLREALETGRAGLLFKLAKGTVLSGLALRLSRRPLAPQLDRVASMLYLAAGLSFRFAWVAAGRNSADDDAAVARAARSGLGAAGGETHAPATGYPVGGTAESPDRTTFS